MQKDMQFNEVINKKNSFLPPIRTSKNKFCLSKKDPIIFENNLSKSKELLEIGLDKFSILTNQPRSIEKIKIYSYVPKSYSIEDMLGNKFTSSTNYEWNTREFPKLRINRFSDLSLNFTDKPSEKKKKLLFEQKLIIEQKQLEQNFRNIRANELFSKSNETYKRITKEKTKRKNFESHLKKDLWSSSDFKDINLKNDIINTFYAIDNRSIRQNRKIRNDFFTFPTNKIYQEIKDQSSSLNINT